MSPQHGIFIINIVIYIICTIPFATTNHIHHSSYPLPFASISGENDIPQKSIRSYSTNNGEWRRNYRIVDIIENVNMTRTWRKGRKTSDGNVFQYFFFSLSCNSHDSFFIYLSCVYVEKKKREESWKYFSHVLWFRRRSFFLDFLVPHFLPLLLIYLAVDKISKHWEI